MKCALILSVLMGVVIVGGAQQPPPAPATPGQPVTPPRAGAKPAAPEKGTAMIRGAVVSDDGSPVRRAEVFAQMMNGPQRYFGVADENGRFVVPDLPAGRYRLSASKLGYLFPGMAGSPVPREVQVEVADRQVVEKIELRLSKGAVITGRIVDDLGDPAVNVQIQALRFAYRDGVRQLTPAQGAGSSGGSTDDLGQFRLYGLVPGDYFISATPRTGGMMREATREQAPARTFFPGTQDVVEARRVRAVAGKETGPIGFALGTTRVARVRGVAYGSSGTPLTGQVSIAQQDPIGGGGWGTGHPLRPDGTFEFNSVAPGMYVVTARDTDGFSALPNEQGSIRITVAGVDLEGLTIFAGKEATLRGRVVTDDGSPLPPGLQRARIQSESADPSEQYVGGQMRDAVLNDDGTFELKGLFGHRRLRIGPMQDWRIRATLVNGEDVTDTGIEFGSGQVIEDAQIIMSRKATRLLGAITDRSGQPVPRATVVLFAEDERLWRPRSRYIQSGTTNEKGRYGVFGAPPSDLYLAVAVTGLEEGQWADPEFLRAVKDLGTRVRLADGETRTVDLKVLERQ